jgi:anti-anti-sigma regulatory factor
MLVLHLEKIGDLAVVECEGRIVRSEEAFKLREAVTSLRKARIIVLDLSEVRAIEGGGLGMLLFLQRWAYDHDIQFKLFNPIGSVRDRLELVNSITELDVATLYEMTTLLANADRATPKQPEASLIRDPATDYLPLSSRRKQEELCL